MAYAKCPNCREHFHIHITDRDDVDLSARYKCEQCGCAWWVMFEIKDIEIDKDGE